MSGFNFKVGGVNVGGGGAGARGASKGCGGGCGAVFGVLIGIVLIPLGFYLAYHAEAKLVNHGKVFEALEMVQPEATRGMEGELVKTQGQPQGDFLRIDEWDGQALYYYKRIEEYEREEDSDGDVSYSWNTASTDRGWVSSFRIDGIEIRPEGANPVGEKEVYKAYRKRFETDFHVGTEPGSAEVGDMRKSVEVLDATSPVIVVGEISGGSIQGGYSFVVSTQNEQQTLETLKREYKMAKWGMRAGAVFAIFMGIMLIFGPLTTLVGYIPLVGDHLSCAFAGIAFVFALVSVTIVTLFIKAFWFLVAIVVIGVAVLAFRGITTPRERPGSGGADDLPPPVGPTPSGASEPPADVSPARPSEAGPAVPRPTEAPTPAPPAQDAPPQGEAPDEPPPASAFLRPAEPSEEPKAEGSSASDFLRPAEPAERAEESSTPKFCANCGSGLDPASKFCRECGHRIE
ncbi:MAG: TMEM43 family protein [Armatimonadota bacterium]|jgi:hypothetical protein